MAVNCPMCERFGCSRPAVGFLALTVRTPENVLDDGHASSANSLTFPTGPQLCEEHAREAIENGRTSSRAREAVDALANVGQVQLDRDTAELVLLALDDPRVERVARSL